MRKTFVTKSETETIALAEKLGRQLKGGETVFLEGDLGGGKTTFSKGLGKGLGVCENITSPTFTIEQIYGARNGLAVFHYDFYRLAGGDIAEMEFLENMGESGAVVIVEWGLELKDLLPEKRLEVYFTYLGENERRIEVVALGQNFEEMAAAL